MSDTNIEITTFNLPAEVNSFAPKVAELIKAQAELVESGSDALAAATFTEPKATANKAAVKFAKAVNAAGHGARKRSQTENADGTVTYVFTLGKIRELGKGKVEAAVVAETPAEDAKVDSAATGK